MADKVIELHGKQPADAPVLTACPYVVFVYDAGHKNRRVMVAGTFNSWADGATEAIPMVDPEGDGVYEAAIELDPGRYEYKFLVDGSWVEDPDNPASAPDGFGGHNSVLKVVSRAA